MSKSAALLLVLVFLTASWAGVIKPVWASAEAVEDSWVSKAPLQEARGGLGVAVVNGKIYAIGGSIDTLIASYGHSGQVGTNEEYDPATNKWVYKLSMPTPRSHFAIAAYQNKIYCIGGYLENSSNTGVNEVYDPETDTWETKTAMPTARRQLQANVVGDKIYLIGGAPDGTVIEVYDPATDSWTTKAPMPTETNLYASAVVNNRIYIIDGNRTQIYNAETDTWSSGAESPSHTMHGAAGVTTGALAPKRIYVMGVTKPITFADPPPCLTQVYDTASDSWAAGASMPTNRVNFGVAVINDTIYAIGGHTHDSIGFITPSAVNEQYTPIGYGTPDTTDQSQSPLLIYAVAAGAAAITIIAITAVALKRRHPKTTN
jgi:N-acetylneuraminic acid mutarotase